MSKWSTWDPASALTGSEVIPLLQGGANKRTTAALLAALAAQKGVASQLASGDVYPMYIDHGGMTWGAINAINRVQFYLARLDAPMTITDVVLALNQAAVGHTIDISIYQFLGCGKPGLCLAKGQISAAATGKRLGTVGTPVTLPAGLYYVAQHGTSTSALFARSSNGNVNLANIPMVISDGYEKMSNSAASQYESVLVTDASLPGGAYTFGMDLTGFTMSSTSILGYDTTHPLVGLKKQ